MTSSESTQTSRTAAGIRTSTRSVNTEKHPITGVVNRVKVPNATERNAVLQDPSIETVMLSIDSVRRLLEKRRETANTYFRDDQTVISTTTTKDATLRDLSWKRELELIRQFGPDYHIPTEYSIYETMTEAQQEDAIDDCMEGTEWMAKRLGNHSTQVLLQAKGWLPRHFARVRPFMERLETDFVVYYATGYGSRVHELNEDLRALIRQLKPSGILVIGKQSRRFLRQTVPEVVGVAGCRWWRKSGLADGNHLSAKHKEWKNRVEDDLSCGQAILATYR